MNLRRVAQDLAFGASFALLAWLVLAALPAPARAAEPAVPARSLSAEERLDAIRHGLVQAALEGATRVESVAWLDSQGRLQESSSFRSGMQVRGVQVLSYLRDPEGQPRARLQLPAAAGAGAVTPAAQARRDLYKDTAAVKAVPACPSNQGLRHLIGLEMAVAGRWSAQDAPMALALAELVQATWLQTDPLAAPSPHREADLSSWRMLAEGEPLIRTGDEAPRSAYEQALLGRESPPLPWRVSLLVVPGPQAAAAQHRAFWQPLLGQAPAAPASARISLSLHAHGQQQGLSAPILTLAADVALLREPSQWGAPRLSPAGRAQVLALLERWSATISAQLACEAVRPEILPSASAQGMLRMNVGALAGVRPGEEWLVADPAAFPERLLAPGVAQQLVLVKVHQVHARHAELQVMAGPARPVQPGWKAWRAESPLAE